MYRSINDLKKRRFAEQGKKKRKYWIRILSALMVCFVGLGSGLNSVRGLDDQGDSAREIEEQREKATSNSGNGDRGTKRKGDRGTKRKGDRGTKRKGDFEQRKW